MSGRIQKIDDVMILILDTFAICVCWLELRDRLERGRTGILFRGKKITHAMSTCKVQLKKYTPSHHPHIKPLLTANMMHLKKIMWLYNESEKLSFQILSSLNRGIAYKLFFP